MAGNRDSERQVVITGIGMLAMALTLGSRFGSTPPPNLGAMSLLPTVGGVLASLLGWTFVHDGQVQVFEP